MNLIYLKQLVLCTGEQLSLQMVLPALRNSSTPITSSSSKPQQSKPPRTFVKSSPHKLQLQVNIAYPRDQAGPAVTGNATAVPACKIINNTNVQIKYDHIQILEFFGETICTFS